MIAYDQNDRCYGYNAIETETLLSTGCDGRAAILGLIYRRELWNARQIFECSRGTPRKGLGVINWSYKLLLEILVWICLIHRIGVVVEHPIFFVCSRNSPQFVALWEGSDLGVMNWTYKRRLELVRICLVHRRLAVGRWNSRQIFVCSRNSPQIVVTEILQCGVWLNCVLT